MTTTEGSPKINVLFLMVDGVLNSTRTMIAYNESERRMCDPISVKLVERLCVPGDMKIMVCDPDNVYEPEQFLIDIGAAALSDRVIDPVSWQKEFFCDRRFEVRIKNWLERNKEYVNDYLVLCNTNTTICNQELHARSVFTLPHEGLSTADYLKSCEILTEKKERQNENP